jgi:hypothetical protein
MFGSVFVRHGDGGIEIADHEEARIRHGLRDDVAAREAGGLYGQLVDHGLRQFRGRRHQQHLRDDVVFGLCEQVGRNEARIRRIVGDDQDFGRAGGQVDGGAGRIRGHDLLGGGDPGAAGSEDLVNLADALGAECQRGNGLRTTHLVDGFDAAQFGRHQHGGVQLAVGAR